MTAQVSGRRISALPDALASFGLLGGVVAGGLTVGAAEHQLAVHGLEAPAGFDEAGREVVQELRMGRAFAEHAEVAGPGFLNLRLRPGLLVDLLDAIVDRPAAWGQLVAPSAPKRVNVEFVSANPTGPLTIGNARGAFVGDLLARVLEAAGEEVTREYYFNDFGEQVRRQIGRAHV